MTRFCGCVRRCGALVYLWKCWDSKHGGLSRSLDISVPVGGADILFRSILLQDYMLLAVTGLYVRSNGLPNERDFTP